MSFYLRGISFVDLAHLRKSDLKDGYLHYTRSKTGQRLTIRWEDEMQELLEKYQAQTASSSYLFPFLVDDGIKDRTKLLTKRKTRYACITMRKRVSLTTSESQVLRQASRASSPSMSPVIPGQRRQETMIFLSPSSVRHWDIIPKPPHKSISAPLKAQKQMMPTPKYWQPYKPQKRIKRGILLNEPK